MSGGVARYAYLVGRGLGDLDGATGLREAPLALVTQGGLDAVVSDVPLAEFDETALRANLERLDWLEEVARTHDQVVRVASERGPVAPLRLATIFHDDEAVRRRLEEWHTPIVEVLDRVDGRREWSVKVVLPPPPPRAVPASEPTTGTEFLRRRQAETGDRAAQQEDAARLAREIHADLTALGEASRLLPPQDPQLTGHSGAMVLNGAYLVPRRDEDRFAHRVAELEAQHGGVLVETGGPWPPYSFAVLEQT